ncbi:MAG: TIGR00303 family protein [Candidatus Lokiarchaeota archaeon]|nr:TIGR00303 family protein [Candidatus Lokiarchaeota archaeon]
MMKKIIEIGNEDKINNFRLKIEGKKPLFICVIGNTETAKIPGISAAGAKSEITDYTPAADVEYLYYGKCKCLEGVPITPEGIPTPGLITKAALDLANIPRLIVSGGVNVFPQAPYIDLGGEAGGDISKEKAVKDPIKIFKNAKILGKNLSFFTDYLVIGESIAGGTTTALGMLLSMGYDVSDKISSSLAINPIQLKLESIDSGMKAKKLSRGDFKNEPFKAIEFFGDPMQPAHAGIAIGAASRIPVILAGGTQMTAILAIINILNPEVLENIAIGTTRWILNDQKTDLEGIVAEVSPKVPILAANLFFDEMRFPGLRAYENGMVKEGVGAGGAVIACVLSSKNQISMIDICKRIEKDYETITTLKQV